MTERKTATMLEYRLKIRYPLDDRDDTLHYVAFARFEEYWRKKIKHTMQSMADAVLNEEIELD
ncbi:hypothetical protein LCGC14_0386780 [marine sediment metagenome]|uniref:Uncharacterized protein n=1 Tax=marine sediment metagenome TaxID=412755 RepID=A0A0F9T0M5_9ZZZZ